MADKSKEKEIKKWVKENEKFLKKLFLGEVQHSLLVLAMEELEDEWFNDEIMMWMALEEKLEKKRPDLDLEEVIDYLKEKWIPGKIKKVKKELRALIKKLKENL